MDPTKKFDVPADVLEHAREVVDRGQALHAEWQAGLRRLGRGQPRRRRAARPAVRPDGCRRAGPTSCRPSRRTPRASPPAPPPARCSTRSRRCCPSCGAARPTSPRATTPPRRATVVPAGGPADQGVPGRPVRPDPALRHPRARHGRDPQRHRAARRHPPVRRHVPHLQRLHARRGPARRADEAAGHLRLDPRLDRPRRGRPDPPADRAPGRAARHPGPGRRPARRRQRDRRRLADHPGAHRPARPG